MKHLCMAALAAASFLSTPAAAEETCTQCPRVQLLRSQDQIRIAAEDDEDAYELLRHRVRFITSNGSSAWTDWAQTNAYGLRTATAGQLEAETIDLQGNVGHAVIIITVPDVEAGTRGPGTVEEDSSVEARWAGGTGSDGTTVADLPEQEQAEEAPAAEWLEAQEWDHSVCPVAPAEWSADDEPDGACSTTSGPNSGLLASLLAVAAVALARVRR